MSSEPVEESICWKETDDGDVVAVVVVVVVVAAAAAVDVAGIGAGVSADVNYGGGMS